MIGYDLEAFIATASRTPADWGPPCAKAVFLVSPDGFARAEESAGDNAYMADADAFDATAALNQHRALHVALARTVPTFCFAGPADTPDASLPEMLRITTRASKELRAIQGVRNFGAHIGQAFAADEVVGANFGENWIRISRQKAQTAI